MVGLRDGSRERAWGTGWSAVAGGRAAVQSGGRHLGVQVHPRGPLAPLARIVVPHLAPCRHFRLGALGKASAEPRTHCTQELWRGRARAERGGLSPLLTVPGVLGTFHRPQLATSELGYTGARNHSTSRQVFLGHTPQSPTSVALAATWARGPTSHLCPQQWPGPRGPSQEGVLHCGPRVLARACRFVAGGTGLRRAGSSGRSPKPPLCAGRQVARLSTRSCAGPATSAVRSSGS